MVRAATLTLVYSRKKVWMFWVEWKEINGKKRMEWMIEMDSKKICFAIPEFALGRWIADCWWLPQFDLF